MPIAGPPTKSRNQTSSEEVIMHEHLAELRGRIVLLTWISGLAWTAVALIGGLLVAGTLDWLIHLDDPGTRLLLGLSIAGGSGWMMWRHLVAPLRIRLTGSFLASRLEHRFPDFQDRVVSAVEFLEHQYDEKLGSAELQKAVVSGALKDLHRIHPSDVVNGNAVRNVAIAGLGALGLATIVLFQYPGESTTFLERLALPFATIPWPRAVELQLVQTDLTLFEGKPAEPLLIARGDTLELFVRNRRGGMPERVWFEYRDSVDGQVVRETLRQTTVRDAQGKSVEVASIHWVASRGPLYFRASGGDDSVMPFYHVEVVPPPTIQNLDVTVTPPDYSRREAEKLPPGVGHVQGLLGTKVTVNATCDKPLKSVNLRIGEQPGVPIAVNEDGLSFAAEFEIKEPFMTSYWFELTDQQGFSDREAVRYELRGIADGVPDVTIENPASDVLLTADAELPVKILAKDDLRLKEIRIAYQLNDDPKIHVIPLYDRVSQQSHDVAASHSPEVIEPQRMDVEHVWKMAELALEPGARIVFRGEATDDYDLGQPHIGKSIPRKITIVSGAEKQRELAERVGQVLEDLRFARQLQERATKETDDLQTQMKKVGELRPQDLDQLGRTELDQRQTASRLSNPTNGVESQARELLQEFRSNKLKDEGTEQRLDRIATELSRLSREELPDAEQLLTQAQKLAEQQTASRAEKDRQAGPSETQPHQNDIGKPNTSRPSSNSKPDQSESDGKQDPNTTGRDQVEGAVEQNATDPQKPADEHASESGNEKSAEESKAEKNALESALAEAREKQKSALESLTDLETSLSEWRDRREIARDLDSVIAEQESIQKAASELLQSTLSKSSAELTKQQKAELDKLSARQNKVAEQLEQFRDQLQSAAKSIEKNEPEVAEKFVEAEKELDHQATAGKMRDAAENIADNKMGDAAKAQAQALQELREVVRMMKRQPNEDTEQFLKQTDAALQEFQQLKKDQQDLADQFQQLSQQPESAERNQQMRDLMEKQDDLAQRMTKVERRLERLRLHGPAESLHQARKRISEMMKRMPDAEDGDEMQDAMDDVLDELEQGEQQLVLEKRVAQERLAFEQLEKIEDELKSLKERQQAVIVETVRLEAAKAESESLTRGQAKTLKDLSETERSLQRVAEELQERMKSADVFVLVLKRLSRSLLLSADRLGERDTSQSTQTLEADAIRKIDALLSVLKQEQKKQQQQQPQQKPEQLGQERNEQEEQAAKAQPPGDMIPQLAQLKLLKSLQEEYLERTELIEKFRNQDGKLPESMEEEMAELAREQAELADYARNLVAKFLQQQPEPQEGEKDSDKTDASKPADQKPDGEKAKDESPDPTKIDP